MFLEGKHKIVKCTGNLELREAFPRRAKVRLGPEERAGAVAVVVAEWRSESAPGSAF